MAVSQTVGFLDEFAGLSGHRILIELEGPDSRQGQSVVAVLVMNYGLAPPSDAVASVPPSPMVSTADEGTITMEPFSLMASYSMFMARRCRATGFSA